MTPRPPDSPFAGSPESDPAGATPGIGVPRRPLPSDPHDLSASDPALVLLRQEAQDLAGLERMLMAWAVCPGAGEFDRVRLLVWDPGRARLVGRLWWERGPAETDPCAAIQRARRMPNEGPWPERTRTLRSVAVDPERLSGVAAEAWHEGAVVVGPARGADASASSVMQGALTLIRGGHAIGLVIGEWDAQGDAVARIESLRRFQSFAGVALDAQSRRAEVARRSRQAGALAEFSRTAASPCNLREIMEAAARLAAEATGARGSAVWLGTSEAFELRATHGPADARERIGRGLQRLAIAVHEHARPLLLDRAVDEPRLGPDVAAELHALAVLPLVAYGRGTGALAVYDRATAHPAEGAGFDAADAEFLTTLASLVALAQDQAARCESLRLAELRQRDLQQQLARGERMAALGEMAARAAQEVRNPLASIGAFARRVHRDLAAEDPSRQHLEIVIRESERLERVIAEQLQYATLQPPRLALQSLNSVIQAALQNEGERLVRRRVRLLKKLAPDLPALLLDSGRIRRVVGNILDHTLESLAPGGRVKVETRRNGSFVVLDIGSDAPRQPGEVMELLFVPFALSRQGGPGAGLAVAQQILKEHGGELRVRGEGEWSSVFSVSIPIPANQDRRRPGGNRRSPRADRRERFPAG